MVLAALPHLADPTRIDAQGRRPLWTYAHVPSGSHRRPDRDRHRDFRALRARLPRCRGGGPIVPAARMAEHNANSSAATSASAATTLFHALAGPTPRLNPWTHADSQGVPVLVGDAAGRRRARHVRLLRRAHRAAPRVRHQEAALTGCACWLNDQTRDHLLLGHWTRHHDGATASRRPPRRRAPRCASATSPKPATRRRSRRTRRGRPTTQATKDLPHGDRRRHRLGRRGDLRVTDAIRFGRFAIARLPRLAGRTVVGGQARRQGLRGVHVDEHRARRPGDDASHAVRHADALRRHHRAARLHRCAEVRRRKPVRRQPHRGPRQHQRVRRARPTTRSTTWRAAWSASPIDLSTPSTRLDATATAADHDNAHEFARTRPFR